MPSWAILTTVTVIALGGLLLVWWALFGDRLWREPRCPKCWYSMIGATGLRCPECGYTAKGSADLHRRHRRWRWACLGLLVALFVPSIVYGVRHKDELLLAILPAWKFESEQQIAGYTIRLYSDRRETRPIQARVLKDGERMLTVVGWDVSIGEESEDGPQIIGIGEDITGDGVPNLILHEYSGGLHCCSTHYILALDQDMFWPVATINAEHSPATFEDLDGDGVLEIRMYDWTFAYWRVSYAASPFPEVILRYKSGQYVLATNLMRKEAPPETELWDRADKIIRETPEDYWVQGSVPSSYWEQMLDLIYTGHEAQAWEFADRAWPDGCPGKDEFLADFRGQLARSPYWPAVRSVGFSQPQ